MNFVEPIRDRKKIAQIKNQLRGQRRYRDLLLLVVGINTALRISDLLQLRVGLFIDDHKRIRQRFWIKEQKRNKRHEVAINQSIREALREYLGAYYGVTEEPNNFVFSTPRQMVTPNPSSEVRLGCSSFRSATMLDCGEIMVPTV
jgi:integrase